MTTLETTNFACIVTGTLNFLFSLYSTSSRMCWYLYNACTEICLNLFVAALFASWWPLWCSSLCCRLPFCKTEKIPSCLVRHKDEKAQMRAWYYHSWWFEIKNYRGIPVYVAEGCFPVAFQWDLFFERLPHAGHPPFLHDHSLWFSPLKASSCFSWEGIAVTEAFP